MSGWLGVLTDHSEIKVEATGSSRSQRVQDQSRTSEITGVKWNIQNAVQVGTSRECTGIRLNIRIKMKVQRCQNWQTLASGHQNQVETSGVLWNQKCIRIKAEVQDHPGATGTECIRDQVKCRIQVEHQKYRIIQVAEYWQIIRVKWKCWK
jgi:hypothetical protein